MKYAKTLKENLQLVKEDHKVVVIHTKNGKVDFIEKGEYMVGKGGGTIFVRDAGVDFKDFVGDDPKAAKDSLVKYSRFDPKSIIIEGCGKIEESDVPTSKRELYNKAKIGFNGLKKRLDDILSLVEKGEYKFVSSFLDDVATSCQRMAKAYDDADRMDKAGKMTESLEDDEVKTVEESVGQKLNITLIPKPSNMKEVEDGMRKGYGDRVKAVVDKVYKLSRSDYEKFIYNFMAHTTYLNGEGGSDPDGTVHVIEISAPGQKTIYVDPEGYDYARYVGW